MKGFAKFFLICFVLITLSACKSSVDRFSILKKCSVLGDEAIIYARGHYVKLFHHFNPQKFAESYQQITDFDPVTHRNTIDTYTKAIEKIYQDETNIDDFATQNLLSACTELSAFSKQFVEEDYRLAINHVSKNDPLTDAFFIEINRIVKFDHNIGVFDENETSFKQNMESYKKAVSEYVKLYRKDIPTDYIEKNIAQ